MKHPSVAELRQQGYRVRVRHTRMGILAGPPIAGTVRELDEMRFAPGVAARGGQTSVDLWLPGSDMEDDPCGRGVADCSAKDSYNKKRGVEIALGRALKAAEAKTARAK